MSRYNDGVDDFRRHRRRTSPSSFRVPITREPRRAFDSPPRHDAGGGFRPPSGSAGGFRPVEGGSGAAGFRPMEPAIAGGFRPMGGGGGVFHAMGGSGGGFGFDYSMPPPPRPPLPQLQPQPQRQSQPHPKPQPQPPSKPQPQPQSQPQSLSGQKRGFASSGRVESPGHDVPDRGSFVKLFVGSVPRTAREEDVRPFFEGHGKVIEVAFIKDKRTGQQQGCCFVKYATSEEADRAIRALHNQYTLPGAAGPMQVRYADGERERLGAVEYKLFVGSLNKQATEKEVEQIFSQYGRVEDVYLMRDEYRQSRGCGFVKYSNKDTALAAINGLNGVYTMRGCNQPLTVRFADPKKPRLGDSSDTIPAYGGPGSSPQLQAPGPRQRPVSNFGDHTHTEDRVLPNAWRGMSPKSMGPSNSGMPGFGSHLPIRPGEGAIPSNLGGPLGGLGGPPHVQPPGPAVSSSLSQQSFNQIPPGGKQVSPLNKPVQSPQDMPPLQLQPQALSSFPQSQSMPVAPGGFAPVSQPLQPQHHYGFSNQLPPSQPFPQHNAPSAPVQQTPLNINIRPNVVSTVKDQQPAQQPPSQLAQLLSRQTQTLQATYQSSQQAFSQLQQQLQSMQPSSQNMSVPPNPQPKQQWNGSGQQLVSGTTAAMPSADVPPITLAIPSSTQPVATVKCNWTEHTSPDGYKYYYNSATRESRWEKPEELTLYEQQQSQKPPIQQPQTQQLHTQQTPQQMPPMHPQLQFPAPLHSYQQSQQAFFPSAYPASGTSVQNAQEVGRPQFPLAAAPVNDRLVFQQGRQAAPELMWKNKASGT